MRIFRPSGGFGKYDKGYAAAFPGCSGLEEKLQAIPNPVGHASLGFSDLIAAFPATAALGAQIVNEQLVDFVRNIELFF